MLFRSAGCGDSGNAPETPGQGSTQQGETAPEVSDEAVSGEEAAGGESEAGAEPASHGEASTVYFTSEIST